MKKNQKSFKANITLVIVVVLAAVAATGWYIWQKKPAITNFDQCVAAGNPIMESFPEQCSADGHTYTKTK